MQLLVGGLNGQITVFEIEDGSARLSLRGHSSQVTEIAFSADNRRILSVAETSRLWYATRPRIGSIYVARSPRESAKFTSFIPTMNYGFTDDRFAYTLVDLPGRN